MKDERTNRTVQRFCGGLSLNGGQKKLQGIKKSLPFLRTGPNMRFINII